MSETVEEPKRKSFDERIPHEWQGLFVLFPDSETDARNRAKALQSAGIFTVTYSIAEALSSGDVYPNVVASTGAQRDFLEACRKSLTEEQIPSTLNAAAPYAHSMLR